MDHNGKEIMDENRIELNLEDLEDATGGGSVSYMRNPDNRKEEWTIYTFRCPRNMTLSEVAASVHIYGKTITVDDLIPGPGNRAMSTNAGDLINVILKKQMVD